MAAAVPSRPPWPAAGSLVSNVKPEMQQKADVSRPRWDDLQQTVEHTAAVEANDVQGLRKGNVACDDDRSPRPPPPSAQGMMIAPLSPTAKQPTTMASSLGVTFRRLGVLFWREVLTTTRNPADVAGVRDRGSVMPTLCL